MPLSPSELRQKLLSNIDNLLSHSWMIHGEQAALLSAVRSFTAADLTEADLTKIGNYFVVTNQRKDG